MAISDLLMRWYEKEKRALPWRESKNPYRIWVSEIILQQTRVNQGMSYYHSFLSKFPDVQSLAQASSEEVLKVWQGLGYYSRARNMHQAAREIVNNRKGKFPDNYRDLLKLKGVGRYTAGAIASSVYNEQVPAVDGNAKRVISRYYGIEGDLSRQKNLRLIEKEASQLVKHPEPGKINQALMDLGAMVCKPVNPDCEVCPLKTGCYALTYNKVQDIPLIYKKVRKKTRHFNYFIIENNSRVLIQQRKGNDIWEGLFEFPLIETPGPQTDKDLLRLFRGYFNAGKEINIKNFHGPVKHVLSHQDIIARFLSLEVSEGFFKDLLTRYSVLSTSDIDKPAWPRLLDRFIDSRFHSG